MRTIAVKFVLYMSLVFFSLCARVSDDNEILKTAATQIAKGQPADNETSIQIIESAIKKNKLSNKNNYFLISALRSISGIKPEDEFFDMFLRFITSVQKAISPTLP